MTDAQAHRGPDGGQVWTAPGVGLGHRRLAIARIAGDAQPMLSRDKQLAITSDGEIFNPSGIRSDLEALGHVFDTASDGELILAAWRQWGPGCLARLDGTFAFALFDAAAQTLFLARDRLGVKPLHHALLSDGSLAFASELKGLLAHPLLRRVPSPQAVEDYLALGYIPDDACLIAGVRKLPAGHCLLARRGRPMPEPVAWWDVDFRRRAKGSAATLGHDLIGHMREAVRSRMVADVPPGAFLSGRVGSSAVIAFMAETSRRAIETISVGFGAPDHEAALIAERFATRHRSRTVAAADLDPIDSLAEALGEPFADPSALAAYGACALARERVMVALSGAGADEVFAGNPRYRLLVAGDRMRRLVPRRARGLLGRIGTSSEEAYAGAVAVVPSELRARLYAPHLHALLQGHRAEDRYISAMRSAPAGDALARAQYADLKIRLPGDILARMDRIGMAVGLETRLPLLDRRLVEFAAALPSHMRLRRGAGKWLMRQALDGILPDAILRGREPDFAAPVGAWFRGPLADRAAAIAHSPTFAELGWFDAAAIARIAADHRSGRSDHGHLLWQLMMLEKSLQRLFAIGTSSAPYTASTKYSPSGGALKPKAVRSRA